MVTVYNKIQELEKISSFSKHEQLVNGIINSIDEKIIAKGTMLPSVNKMIKNLGFARNTIVKAYRDLQDRGLVNAKSGLGYFVAHEDTEQSIKVALLIYAFHPIQETFYNAFRSGLGDNIHLDVFFHHSNMDMFKTILNNIKGKYGMYVVAPIPHPNTKKLLTTLPENKLLIVDRYEDLGKGFSHVTQEFEMTTYKALKELAPTIQQYDEMLLFFRPNSDHPIEISKAFKRFLKDFNIKGKIRKNYIKGMLKKGTVYCTIGDGDLWRLLKDCKEQSIHIGQDIGIVSTSNDPVKEIICDGITTFSTDFEVMGQRAAEFILNRGLTQTTIPTILIRRNSL